MAGWVGRALGLFTRPGALPLLPSRPLRAPQGEVQGSGPSPLLGGCCQPGCRQSREQREEEAGEAGVLRNHPRFLLPASWPCQADAAQWEGAAGKALGQLCPLRPLRPPAQQEQPEPHCSPRPQLLPLGRGGGGDEQIRALSASPRAELQSEMSARARHSAGGARSPRSRSPRLCLARCWQRDGHPRALGEEGSRESVASPGVPLALLLSSQLAPSQPQPQKLSFSGSHGNEEFSSPQS